MLLSLSPFHHAPCMGHLDYLKSGYVCKFLQAAIPIHTGILDHEAIFGEQPEAYDWMETVYGKPTDELPNNMLEPKGKTI